ncbi:unnamed protein product [Caenorhabditis auriculariae]|uniref:Uncharacterized protein n=1 Tax=Caenorhabditis auriculariae TaxID=2777116 RepID=A0A8S1HT47_9PELO|nr:unnamed protein product [Caenorhabditis auriculariae]
MLFGLQRTAALLRTAKCQTKIKLFGKKKRGRKSTWRLKSKEAHLLVFDWRWVAEEKRDGVRGRRQNQLENLTLSQNVPPKRSGFVLLTQIYSNLLTKSSLNGREKCEVWKESWRLAGIVVR